MRKQLEMLMGAERLTSVKLAEILSVQPSNISHIMSGRNKPSYDFIMKIIERFPSVNPEWLLTGVGDIYKCNRSTPSNNVALDSGTLFTNVNNEGLGDIISSNTQNLKNETKGQPASIDIKPKMHLETSLPIADINPMQTKQVDKIIILYCDNSFEIFHKSQN